MSTPSPPQEPETKSMETEEPELGGAKSISIESKEKTDLPKTETNKDNSTKEKENLMKLVEIDAPEVVSPNTAQKHNSSIDESVDYNSSPDNEIRTKTADTFNPRKYTCTKPHQLFTLYTNTIKSRDQFQFFWSKTMKKRLESYEKHSHQAKLQFSENYQINQKIEAAPFPLLPSKYEVLAAIQSIDDELIKEKNKLRQLIKIRNSRIQSKPQSQNLENKKGVRSIFGNIVVQSTFETVKQQNFLKLQKSHKTNFIPNHQMYGKFKRIGDLPYYFKDNSDLSEPILNYLTHRKIEENKFNQQLATEYAYIHSKHEDLSNAVTEYYKLYQRSVDEWPPEFQFSTPRPTELSQVQPYCAPDVIQYKLQEEQECYLYYDENMLVEDPVKEHEQYKRRLTWTDDEKKIFYEKYALHPREFKKIANALPGKSTKDVIEFYFLNRKPMNLHELDLRARTKGHHKKVISEGGAK